MRDLNLVIFEVILNVRLFGTKCVDGLGSELLAMYTDVFALAR